MWVCEGEEWAGGRWRVTAVIVGVVGLMQEVKGLKVGEVGEDFELCTWWNSI